MKKLALLASASLVLMAGAAAAADLPSRRAPPPAAAYTAVPVFTWTGFYVGGNAGYGFSDSNRITTRGNGPVTAANVAAGFRPGSFGASPSGFVGGGQAGYNMQIGAFVVGFETDIMYTDLAKTTQYTSSRGDRASFRSTTDYLGTVRGRIGYAFDRVLVFATGGFAYGDVYNRAAFFNFAAPQNLQFAGAKDDIETGYVVGGGIEYAIPNYTLFNSAVTVKAEYLYYDLGNRNIVVGNVAPTAPNSYTSRFTNDGHIVRAGLNFKFGGF
ncbi:porin family protein [Enterovirga sp.]|uniref:outer membrane protein n=1 Tax=Enterovirga sp. TaxID=2026350 RepID=UPI00260985D5|nr:porin family protein [Enterovirga sp.]